jgi:hypothetical protein
MKKVQAEKPEVKKESPANDITQPLKKEPQPVEFYFDEAGIKTINDYLALTNQSEANGILDYKGAFHKMVELMRTNLKKRE